MDNTAAQIAHIAELHIEQTYGKATRDEITGASLAGIGFLKFDMPDALDSEIHYELERRVNKALEDRRCQCTQRTGEYCYHTDVPTVKASAPRKQCDGYFEADVPEIDGYRLCGTCYCSL